MSDNLCSFEGCYQPRKAKGLCTGHYGQHRRGADLTPLIKYRNRRYIASLEPGESADGTRRVLEFANGDRQVLVYRNVEYTYGLRGSIQTLSGRRWDDIFSLLTFLNLRGIREDTTTNQLGD